MLEQSTKLCPGCERFRPFSAFCLRRKGSRFGLQSYCKDCAARSNRRHREKPGNRQRRKVLRLIEKLATTPEPPPAE